MSGMAKTTNDSILGVIQKFELMLTRRAVNMFGGNLRSPSAFLVLEVIKMASPVRTSLEFNTRQFRPKTTFAVFEC